MTDASNAEAQPTSLAGPDTAGPGPATTTAPATPSVDSGIALSAAESGPGSRRSSRRARLAGLLQPLRSTALGLAVAVVAVVALSRGGFSDDFGNTLQIMGFDPDRAVLLTALLLGAIGALIVAVVGGRFWVAIVAGASILLVAFSHVFRHETGSALHSKGPDGTFDPLGWTLSAFTLLTIALLVGWAAAVLGRDVGQRIKAVRAAVRDSLDGRGSRPQGAIRLTGAVAVLVALVVSVPIFGDMMNFDPDTHMRHGAPAGVGLFGGNQPGGPDASDSSPGPTTSAPAGSGALAVAGELVEGPVPGSRVSSGALGSGRPWAAHPPTGGGRTVSVNLPAPWTGGLTTVATIEIYLPPGYDQGSQHYPVVYEPHQPLWAWEQGMHIAALLDELIRTGQFPPEIVVFVGQSGGPFPDSECADSYDGREWFDRYLGADVPNYVDANFRTMPTPAARSLLGFSSGGYCAAAALTHHPDVFGTALIFSGYFEAGISTTTTPQAGRPFNNDPALEARVSPINVLPRLTPAQRSQLFFSFSADPANRFYGNEIIAFTGVLAANGVPFAVLPTPLGHSWAAVRDQLPAVLGILAARQVKLGVFGSP